MFSYLKFIKKVLIKKTQLSCPLQCDIYRMISSVMIFLKENLPSRIPLPVSFSDSPGPSTNLIANPGLSTLEPPA